MTYTNNKTGCKYAIKKIDFLIVQFIVIEIIHFADKKCRGGTLRIMQNGNLFYKLNSNRHYVISLSGCRKCLV